MMSKTILIIDDETDLLTGLKRLAVSALDCEVHTASSASEALDILKNIPCNLVLSDVRMPGMDGMELLETLSGKYPSIDIILMTAYGSIDQAVEALHKGASDFVTKPLHHDQLFNTIKRCLERQELIAQNQDLTSRLKKQQLKKKFIGNSPALKKALSTMELVADSPVTVLITGESGTGKELAAQTIHHLSDRGPKEMIAVNCAALPEAVLESELFGHRKGAFTGADRNHPGLFAAANGSTLLLDEIGEMPMALQAKLLRVLEENAIRPVGDTASLKIDVRILAATNRDLVEAVRKGTFREDLYFRINEVTLPMPPLRTMPEDIPLLAQYCIDRFCADSNRPLKTISPRAIQIISNAPWPGNVRQLQNVLKRAVLLGSQQTINPEDLDLPEIDFLCGEADLKTLFSMGYQQAKDSFLDKFKTAYLDQLLKTTNGNISQAARKSGLKRTSLQRLIKQYHIDTGRYRS